MKIVYAWAPKKDSRSSIQRFLAHVRDTHPDVQLERLALDQTVPVGLKADVFWHKLNELVYAGERSNDSQAQRQLASIEVWIQQNPQMRVVDSLPSVRKLMDRESMLMLLSQCCDLSQSGIAIPPMRQCRLMDLGQIKDAIQLPWLIKHAEACSSKQSHQMAMVQQSDTDPIQVAKALGTDGYSLVIVQHTVPHSGHLFKVYVIGEHLHIQTRPSLELDRISQASIYAFDSQSLPKRFAVSAKEDIMLSQEQERCIRLLVQTIRSHSGLSLFGLDIVSHHQSNHLFAIDLNYFPSFDDFPNVEQILLRHLSNG